MKILDLFSGAGGWDIPAAALGHEVDGVENWAPARATREAAGLRTVGADVRDLMVQGGVYDALLASPVCTTFSKGGDESGNADRQRLLKAVAAYQFGERHNPAEFADPRTALVLEPLRLALRMMPDYIALEQVPTVLPIWEAYAPVLQSRGYSVAVDVLHAEEYGVPQVRRRAILIARRNGQTARLPRPTHQRLGQPVPLGLLPHVTQADALGWGMTARPYPTLASARTTGGADKEKVGGSGARKILFRERAEGRWIERDNGGRLEIEEAAILQTFPPGFPFQGFKMNRFAQVSNAIPCKLAEAILRALVA